MKARQWAVVWLGLCVIVLILSVIGIIAENAERNRRRGSPLPFASPKVSELAGRVLQPGDQPLAFLGQTEMLDGSFTQVTVRAQDDKHLVLTLPRSVRAQGVPYYEHRAFVVSRHDHHVVLTRNGKNWYTTIVVPDPTNPGQWLYAERVAHQNSSGVQAAIDQLTPPAAPLPDELKSSI